MKFVLASHNRRKLDEMNAILSELGVSVTALPEGAPEPEENGSIFEENALIKARAAAAFTGCPAIADDSGLCVDALNGAPGVYSARYGSAEYPEEMRIIKDARLADGADDTARCMLLLREMADVPADKRQARFVCSIACCMPDGREFTVRGTCEGVISDKMNGAGGFGYDPLFYLPERQGTFGELPQEVKNHISHRAQALNAFAQKLKSFIQE